MTLGNQHRTKVSKMNEGGKENPKKIEGMGEASTPGVCCSKNW